MKLVSIFISLILSCTTYMSGFAQSDWQKLSLDNIEIEHPSDWQVDKSGQMGTSFLLFSPLAGLADNFRENVNVIVQDLSAYGSFTLDEYVDASLMQLKNIISELNIIENERVVDGDTAYQKLIYTGTQGIYSLKFEQYAFLIGEKAYIVTLTCIESEFDNYKEVGEKILSSFVIN